mmetsp:Transcript_4364/g.9875  ORF Transcript_4364/g.9875 Transcript_4364/m.9875 type:complete len:1440 (-) Transcript_4364:6978-11297(-)
MKFRRDKSISSDFSKVIISLASPEVILERSHGEVTQPETINYRTHKPEMKGLFCERIFGPVKDWECHCGKYKRIRYKGIICDRCGVEVTEKKVRRVRMGHIDLVIPVAHIWYFRSLPNKIGYLLGLSAKKLDQIIYYERYVVIQPGIKEEDNIHHMDFLTEEEYLNILDQLPRENTLLEDNDPNKFIAKMGAEALQMLLSRVQLDELSFALRDQVASDTSQQRRVEALKRLRIVEAFRDAKDRIENKPEWMVMRIIPVIPAELRPLVPLEGGRFATSDLNDLYRRVIIRNNRLKRLLDIKAPEVILRNEKRMLQEAVDSLFDNSRRANAVAAEGIRPLKSLSDVLKGKQGRFRQNLLGKRVDYSGRSVIVVGPELKLYECGLPKDMAAELFKPFIIRKLLERGIVKTVKSAKKLVEKKIPVVWDILENALKGHPVLLNRAPTLHRLGIQAFQPKLIEGKAIQLHPLVCTAFNADFDGDTMSVHVPLSQEAIAEAALLMLSAHNILNPANGSPITVPSKDIILGLYYLTKGRKSTAQHPVPGEGMFFYAPEEVIMALNSGKLSQHAHIKVKMKKHGEDSLGEEIIDTVAGRVVFNQYVPEEVGFINEMLTSRKLQIITAQVYKQTNTVRTVKFLDEIKELGFQSAYTGGMSMALDDVKVPQEKYQLIGQAKEEAEVVWNNYMMGLITDRERYNQIIDIWTRVNTQLTNLLMHHLEEDQQGFNSVYMMMHSGARGSREQVRQLGGMRGLMAKPQKSLHSSVGGIIENPIISNFKEGLDVIEYFISTHGARKGLADTALKTADAGYLTRRLVDVAQDVVTTENDCGTLRGITASALKDSDEIIEPISEKVLGRVTMYDIHHPHTKELLIPAGEEITEALATKVEEAGIEEIIIRSVLTCEAERGVCIQCYGRNLATGKMVQTGEAVGVIAAQSIGEPGTQLTLRTFHVGGTASNIAVEAKIKAKYDGIVTFEDINIVETKSRKGKKLAVVIGRSCEIHILDPISKKALMSSPVPYGAYLRVKEGDQVKKEQELCYWDPYNAVIIAKAAGKVAFEAIEEGITYKEEYDEQTGHKQKVIIETKDKTKNPTLLIQEVSKSKKQGTMHYNLPLKARLMVEEGDKIYPGQVLAKIPRMIEKSRDITGGLPRVTELFEARNPSNTAVVSEINGAVTYGDIKRGNREVFIESKEGVKKKYLVPLSKHILVQDNDYVKAGSPLSDGVIAPADILAIIGPTAVQKYLVHELQAVYRLQGVKINDKHIEVIVRQMMSKLEVVVSGDTTCMPGQIVDKISFKEENDKILGKKIVIEAGDSQIYKPGQLISTRQYKQENVVLKEQGLTIMQARDAKSAIAKPKLQGITQTSLGTESFISAASFQETTKVLSEASIGGKCDPLKGLKENVIVGHLVPAGTGLKKYRRLIVGSKEEYMRLMHAKNQVAKEQTTVVR